MKEGLESLSGMRIFGYIRRRNDSRELPQDRRACGATIRSVLNSIGDAGSTHPGWMLLQVQVGKCLSNSMPWEWLGILLRPQHNLANWQKTFVIWKPRTRSGLTNDIYTWFEWYLNSIVSLFWDSASLWPNYHDLGRSLWKNKTYNFKALLSQVSWSKELVIKSPRQSALINKPSEQGIEDLDSKETCNQESWEHCVLCVG